MELLKFNIIIDQKYKPALGLTYIDYFNRALKFAQTNYDDHLVKVTRMNPKSITAAKLFEEYVGALLSNKEKLYNRPTYYIKLAKSLKPYYDCFWDLNNFPSEEKMKVHLEDFSLDSQQLKDIHATAYIISQGIKLFGWDSYRNNFLNCYSKLAVLPGLGLTGAKLLNQNIGGLYCPDDSQQLYNLATRLGFENATELCSALQKNFRMSSRTIGTILWYATTTFDTTDIVSAD